MINKGFCKSGLLGILLVLCFGTSGVVAQEAQPIRVVSAEIENQFPTSLTFKIEIESEHPISEIRLYLRSQGDPVVTNQLVEFERGTSVTASYVMKTSKMTVAPSTPFVYRWQIKDQVGNTLDTEEQTTYYDDIRFDWQEIGDDELVVRWYKGDDAFGRFVYEKARLALSNMKAQSGKDVEFPVFVLLYANQEDFTAWQYYGAEWAGGVAFPPLGITAQIVPPNTNKAWVQDVIPHEIAHLFFYQAMQDPFADWPMWFGEGYAQYYEFGGPDDAIRRARKAARQGKIIPLNLIATSFGDDDELVQLAYDESLSVMLYLLETWGDEGLQRLMEQFRRGELVETAIEKALDVNWAVFEAGWLTWLGVPTTPGPSPTLTETFAFPKGPGDWPTKTPTATGTPIPTQTPTSTATAMLSPSDTPTSIATPTPTRFSVTPTLVQTSPDRKMNPLCSGAVVAMFVPLTFILLIRRVE